MVDKEMAATSAAIEDAVRRIEVRDRLGCGVPSSALEAGHAEYRWHPPQHRTLQRTDDLCRSGPEVALGPRPELSPPTRLSGCSLGLGPAPRVPLTAPASSQFCYWCRI